MPTSHLIFRLSAAVIIGGLIGWRIGYETGSKVPPADPVQCGLDISRQLKVYRAIEATNLSQAEWVVGKHILEMTHDYERWFGESFEPRMNANEREWFLLHRRSGSPWNAAQFS